MDQPQQSVTPSPPQSPPPSPSPAVSSIAHLTGLIVAVTVALPIGLSLPRLIELATGSCGQWKPLAAALLALGAVAAPAPTLELVRRFLPGVSKDK